MALFSVKTEVEGLGWKQEEGGRDGVPLTEDSLVMLCVGGDWVADVL